MSRPASIRLSAAVLTHPARLRYAEEMRRRHPELDLRIVVDPAPGAGSAAAHAACRLAWAAVDADATHHLVVEDDTVLCAEFRERLMGAIAARGDQAIACYTEWGSETSYAVRLAALAGAAWADVVDDYVPTQALVLPADVARGFSESPDESGPLLDYTMRTYLASVGVPAHVTVPNLAEDARLPSLTGHDHLGERASVCFLGNLSADIDWSAAVVPATVPAMSYGVGQAYSVVRGGDGRWRRALQPLIPRHGSSLEATLDAGRQAVQRWPALVSAVGTRLLLALWLTAHGLGLVAAELLDRDTDSARLVDRVPARPIVRQALATMPRGALRFLVEVPRLIEHSPRLTRLVELGVRQGFEAGRAVRLGRLATAEGMT